MAALSADWHGAELSAADRIMLTFVDKLTRTPQAMKKDDVTALRAHGFDDRSIHDIVVVAAYYAFVNRVADGLGVTLEPGWSGESS